MSGTAANAMGEPSAAWGVPLSTWASHDIARASFLVGIRSGLPLKHQVAECADVQNSIRCVRKLAQGHVAGDALGGAYLLFNRTFARKGMEAVTDVVEAMSAERQGNAAGIQWSATPWQLHGNSMVVYGS